METTPHDDVGMQRPWSKYIEMALRREYVWSVRMSILADQCTQRLGKPSSADASDGCQVTTSWIRAASSTSL